jgi:hemerythrin-like metal-binding protein
MEPYMENHCKQPQLADMPVTGDDDLDSAHRILYGELWRVAALPRDRFADGFHGAVALLERDFQDEEALMERIEFPGLRSHREQHARALSGLHHAAAALTDGTDEPARHALGLLTEWLAIHIATMDLALAVACSLARQPRATGA